MQSMFEKCSNKCVVVSGCGDGGVYAWACVWEGWWGVKGWVWVCIRYVLTGATMHAHSTTCSTNMLSSCRSPMTKEYNWQIHVINISVTPFCNWLAACTSHLCAPISWYNIHLKGKICLVCHCSASWLNLTLF